MTRRRCRKDATFPTAEQARREVERCQAKAARGDSRRRECGIYPCVIHRGWHLTSHPREEASA